MTRVLFGLSLQLFSSVQRPAKVLTPEQIVYQANLKTYDAKVERLRASANTSYTAEAAREKTPPCPNADSTLAENQCLVQENDITTANYKAFTTALRAILALPRPRYQGEPAVIYGPSGPEATPATSTAAFEAAEAAWTTYAKAQCNAVDVEWRGGTIVNAMYLECTLRQTRARLHELETTYLGHM